VIDAGTTKVFCWGEQCVGTTQERSFALTQRIMLTRQYVPLCRRPLLTASYEFALLGTVLPDSHRAATEISLRRPESLTPHREGRPAVRARRILQVGRVALSRESLIPEAARVCCSGQSNGRPVK
jgi:hypothetical protein